jgi:hypothetical protein
MKQTAVEWAINEIRNNWYDYEYGDADMDDLINQAKAMEKEQMGALFAMGMVNGINIDFEEFYKETYESKTNI